jgi:hypothetical protein
VSSSLTFLFGRWEHTPEWQLTSKLLISKHQQVQLLEAASVLVAMNQTLGDKDSIDSPLAGPRSDSVSGMSSSEDSPSPRLDGATHMGGAGMDLEPSGMRKRFSSNSSAYSRSYESSVFSDGRDHGHHRQWSSDHIGRPTTSGTSVAGSLTDDELAEQTAAASLLSCSYGTAASGNAYAFDIPPVPPVPARFQATKDLSGTPNENQLSGSGSTIRGGSHGVASYDSYVRGDGRNIDDVEMMDHDDEAVHISSHATTAHYYHDEEEGMFGRMDE